jgi:hypothetical protein
LGGVGRGVEEHTGIELTAIPEIPGQAEEYDNLKARHWRRAVVALIDPISKHHLAIIAGRRLGEGARTRHIAGTNIKPITF